LDYAVSATLVNCSKLQVINFYSPELIYGTPDIGPSVRLSHNGTVLK